MSQSNLIIEALKQELRKQGFTYKHVADGLGISEASVKRVFAEKSFSLARLDQVCDLLNLEISDVVQQMEKNIELTDQLTLEQEKELVSDIKLILMAYFLVNKLEFSYIIKTYDISETEGIHLLAELDRMKVIELQPGNRVKLMISKHFKFIPDGPIEHYFERQVQSEFFESSFGGAGEFRIFISGMFSRDANAELIRKLKRLAEDAHLLKDDSESLHPEEKFGCSLMMAIRPWEVKVFDELRREPNIKIF